MHPWQATSQINDPIFGRTRAAPLVLVLVTVAAHIALKALFFSSWFLQRVAAPLETSTHGLLQPATLAGLIQLAVLVGFGIFLLGRLSPEHLGLRTSGLQRLVPIVLLIWALSHLICLGLGATPLRMTVPVSLVAGSLLEATAGSAIPEELFYRGFLLVQLFLILRTYKTTWTSNRCLVVAMVVVQTYFAANHIPAAERAGLSVNEALLWLLHAALVGGMMSVLFIQTGNILMPVAAHALINLSLPLLESPISPQVVLLILVCLTMVSGKWLFGRPLVPTG